MLVLEYVSVERNMSRERFMSFRNLVKNYKLNSVRKPSGRIHDEGYDFLVR